MILSMLYRFSPMDLRLLLIDPKMLEFAPYNDIPHLMVPPITASWRLLRCSGRVKRWIAATSVREVGAKNIKEYNDCPSSRSKSGRSTRKELNEQILAEADKYMLRCRLSVHPELKMAVDEQGDAADMQVVERGRGGGRHRGRQRGQQGMLPPDHALSEDNDPEPCSS